MNDISSLQSLGEESYIALSGLVGALDALPPEQKSEAFHALADLLDSLQDEFSCVRRIDQPPTEESEKSERVDVLVNWLREKA
ncbi:MAG TPA: hypothetical protein VF604_19480 [Pyrinomonadaceae bacterium]|jgi:hypothetical protein